MKKYTFILEFKKGTYVKQVISSDIQNAKIVWFDSLKADEVFGMTDDLRNIFKKQLDNEYPALLDGMDSVCFSKLEEIIV
ncbi:hypothetical protein ACFE6N_07500 [Pedobacter sp. BG31]|uniref:hypothetical protein n=1 Tax=Pedobacter sp. BG31 TaxID=3349697 RepID=UPI0035F2A239